MDIRYLIVGTPFIVAFFYTLFWLKKWGAFNSSFKDDSKKITLKDNSSQKIFNLENIFLMKN